MQQISKISMTFTRGNSNKYYDVFFALEDGFLSVKTEYGRIGANPSIGVCSSFKMDVEEVIQSGTIGAAIDKLISEANKIVSSKTAKGYIINGNNNFNGSAIEKSLRSIFKTAASTSVGKQQDNTSPLTNSIEVEVVGMSCGVPTVAKVLGDFNYQVLGEALNPYGRQVRTGDVVNVFQKENRWILS